MLKKYTESLTQYVPTFLRIMLGITFFLHGLPKWSNIPGFTGFLSSLGVPLPGLFGVFIPILETVGGLLLIVGLGTRWVGLLLVVEMIVTTAIYKVNFGFIAPTNEPGTGFELDLMLLVTALALVILGSGALSVEQNVLKREL